MITDVPDVNALEGAGTAGLSARLLRAYAAGQWAIIFLGIALLLLASGAALLQPWPLKLALDSVVGNHALPERLAKAVEDLHSLVAPSLGPKLFLLGLLCAAIVLLQLALGLLQLGSTFALVRAGLRMVFRLRCAVFDHLQRLSFAFHDSRTVGDSLYRVAWDTYSIQAMFNTGIIPALSSSLTLAGIIVVLLSRDWALAALAIALAVPFAVLIRWLDRPMTERSMQVHARESDLTTKVQETLTGIRAVQAFGREDFETGRFRQHAEASLQANLALTTLQTGSQSVVGLLFAIATAATLWLAGVRVLDGRLTPGDLVLLVSYLVMVQKPLEALVYTAATVQSAAAGARRVLTLLAAVPDVKDAPAAIDVPGRAAGHFILEDVCFAYRPGRPVLSGINLEIAPGERIALVGASGAGKTTLASLLLRFYDPTKGRILLDGQDIRDFTIASLRRNVALVLQDHVLFGSTVLENIAYGRPNATPKEITIAADAAGIGDFVKSLPKGYDTQIGEQGVALSGGQRQRISIARAFLKDAPVLVLDEPTSALDAEVEAHILSSMKSLMRGRTTIIISHRLSTVRDVDRIVFLKDGRIVETGSHDELLKLRGDYARLYRLHSNSQLYAEGVPP